MELLQKKAEPYVTEYGENQLPGAGQLLNSILRTGTEMVPGVGDLLGAEDLQTAAQNNDWGGIGLGALAAIPGIPSFSRGAGGDIRATGRAVREATEAMPAQYADPSTGAIEVEVLPPEPDYPIRAYHGSPHSFDQFELSPRTIGTGEGAQAFGHGLYFAENEGIARGYRDAAVDPDSVPLQFRGKPVNTPWNDDIRERWADDFAGLSEDDADAFEELLGNLSQVNNLNDVKNVLGNVSPRARALYNSRVRSDLIKPDFGPGSMYEVGINASPDTFLDWDRPLSEQSEAVRRGYAQARASGDPLVADLLGDLSNPTQLNNAGLFPNSGGAQAYNSLTPEAAEASRRLNEYGISGIRYLDANSREAGEGLRNYVVFNDDLVKILRKYGIGGLSTTVGASALAEELDRRERVSQF
jgi:hypothetical protein